jgi:hypothetical protein
MAEESIIDFEWKATTRCGTPVFMKNLRTFEPSPHSARLISWALVMAVVWGMSLPAQAASPHRADVLGAHFSSENWFNARMELRYSLEQTTANIEREYKCNDDSIRCPGSRGLVTARELTAERNRHTIGLDGRFAVGPNLELQVFAPYVLQDIRRVSFADGVGLDNTTLFDSVADEKIEIFNRDYAPKRKGIGDMTFGLRAALLSMEADDTDPDLVVRAEYTAPTAPALKVTNVAVGEGLHQVLVGLDSGYAIAESTQAHLGVATKFRFAADQELYVTGYRTQHLENPGPQLLVDASLTFVPWSPDKEARFFLVSLGGDLRYTGAGREATLLFDALAGSRCSMLPDCHATDYFAFTGVPSNGVTDVQEHFRVGASLEIHYRLPYFELRAGAGFGFTPGHFLSFARYGEDLDQDGEIWPTVEIGGQNQTEYNPVYVEALDKAGSRLLASSTLEFSGFVSTAFRY